MLGVRSRDGSRASGQLQLACPHKRNLSCKMLICLSIFPNMSLLKIPINSRGRGHPKFEPRDVPRSSDLNMRDYNDGRDDGRRMILSIDHHNRGADERMGGRFEPAVARDGGVVEGGRDYDGSSTPSSYKDEYNDNGRRVVAPPPRDERAYERDHHHEDDYNNNNNNNNHRGGDGGYSDGSRVGREEHDYPPTRREHSGGYNHQGRGGRGGGGGCGFGRGGRGGEYGGGGRSGGSRGFIPRGGGSSSNAAAPPPHPSEDPNEPIPEDQRRTLILSNIPHHIKFFHIQEHFNKQTYPGATTGGVNPHGGSGATVQFCIIERGSGEAKVRFKYVEDAMRIWDGGNEGLDGILDGRSVPGGDGDMSFVQLGIRLKAIHFTNFIQDHNPFNSGGTAAAAASGGSAPPDRGVGVAGGDGGGFDRKRGYYLEEDRGGRGRYDDNNGRGGGGGGGYDDYHPEQRPAKAQRYSEDSRDGGPASQRRDSGPPPSNYRGNQNVGDANLWLGNYGPRTTIEDIKAAFAPYVDVSEVVTKEGFSFVNTHDPEGARKAKEALNGTSMDGLPVKIRIANQRKPKFGGCDDIEFDRRRDDNGGGFERKRSYGEDRPPPRYEDELKRSYREEAPRRYEDDRRGGGYDERDRQYDTPALTSRRPESDYPSSNDTYRRGPPSQQKCTPADRPQSKLPYRGDQNVGDANLHLSNYGPRTTPDDIKAMFAPYVHVTEVVTKNGFSFVNTNDSDGARRAMTALNGALLGGSRCRINSATRKSKLGATPEQQAFVKLESDWRKRRQAEYNTFHAEKVARVKHISKLEQKRDLNVDSEASLNQQFNLHHKMLGVMKTNKADLMEQSKKMKEMLTVQTRLTDLMKETQEIVEEMARLKGEEFEFRPSEKRPVFMGPTGGSGPA